jgi:hypothetical protein
MSEQEKLKGIGYLSTLVLVFGLLYFSLTDEMPEKVWFTSTAFEHMIQSILSYSLAKKLHNKYIIITTSLAMLFCISNYLDELWFDPTKTQLNEVVFAVVSTLIIYHKNAKYINSIVLRAIGYTKKK